MFYVEEDITPAVVVAEELFGKAGTMLYGKNVQKNVVIGTNQYGKIWYGDIEGNSDYISSLLDILSQRIPKDVFGKNVSAFVVISDNF